MTVEIMRHSFLGRDIRYGLEAEHLQQAAAERVAEVYMDTIVNAIVNQPRSLQRRIGPSELGIECSRALLHKLAQSPEPADARVPWKPTIGTAVHAYLEEAFGAVSAPDGAMPGRYLTEQRVSVGTVGGVEITGSSDLFDTWEGFVLDHKIIGTSNMKKYRSHGPSEQYRRQAHLYGRGFVRAGHKVTGVGICFLSRDKEFTDSFIWTDPYDEALAVETLTRADGLASLLAGVGLEQALGFFPACEDHWCRWCGSGSSFGRREAATTTAGLFAQA